MEGKGVRRKRSLGVARVTLLHPNVTVTLPRRTKPLPDLQSRGRVLRLLALGEGHFFDKHELADIFEIQEQSVAPMIEDLRNRLGGPAWGREAIETKPGVGYGLRPETVDVDAQRFRSVLERLSVPLQVTGIDDLSHEVAEKSLGILDAALELWRGNPARSLENITADEHRYHTIYEQLYHDTRRLRTLCLLRVGSMAHLRDAILQLQREVDPKQVPDNEPWCLLIRAYFSAGNQDNARRTYQDAVRYYREVARQPLPPPIEDCYRRTASGDPSFGLLREMPSGLSQASTESPRVDAARFPVPDEPTTEHLKELINSLYALVPPGSRPLMDLLRELINVMSTIGVSTATELRLQGSRMEPKQCIRRVTTRLWFTGVLASKWVIDPAVRSELDDLLTVLDHTEDSDVRFMIMNPSGPGYKRLYDLRNGRLSSEHIPHLARLAKRHSSMRVKVFDHLPTFRILVIDRDVVTFSFYRLDENSYVQSDRGWESPHIVLDPLSPWPLAEAFTGLFAESWESAEDLDLERYA